jgi:hypothetical protein
MLWFSTKNDHSPTLCPGELHMINEVLISSPEPSHTSRVPTEAAFWNSAEVGILFGITVSSTSSKFRMQNSADFCGIPRNFGENEYIHKHGHEHRHVYVQIVTNSEFCKWNTVESRGTPPNFFSEFRGTPGNLMQILRKFGSTEVIKYSAEL